MQFTALLAVFSLVFTVYASSTHTQAVSINTMHDPNSSVQDDFRPEHLHLDWTVDFIEKKVYGSVTFTMKSVHPDGSDSLSLDASELHIGRVLVNEQTLPFGISNDTLLLHFDKPLKNATIKIYYSTTENCQALQWLEPNQTKGKVFPFLYSQCQSILARTLLPCQDTPSVKTTYSAEVRIAKPFDNLIVVMSANIRQIRFTKIENEIFYFEQTTPVPSYLIAIGVGNLSSRQIGPRSTIWSEPELIDAASFEFSETEEYLKHAEALLGPYVWGVYDILVLPPSFPYGGMENPCLTFVTPSLLAGDRSLVSVVIHEITHSWSGNLVTNVNWEHFWLNEGFTKFIERKLIGRMQGEPTRQLLAQIGLVELQENVDFIGKDSDLTSLTPNLRGICTQLHLQSYFHLDSLAPDDAYSRVPYEKGHAFLYHLEKAVGGSEFFDPYLRAHIEEFASQSITTEQWQNFFIKYFTLNHNMKDAIEKIDFETWLKGTGMPPIKMDYSDALLLDVKDLVSQWKAGTWSKSSDTWQTFSPHQKVMFFEILDQETQGKLSFEALAALETEYANAGVMNVEIGLKWYMLCLHNSYEPAFQNAANYAIQHGRLKYCRPILRELGKLPEGRPIALKTFEESKDFFHPHGRKMIAADLKI